MNLSNIDLIKWPGLLVLGKPVTKEQAQEINIRTSSLPYMSSNDRKMQKHIYSYLYKQKVESWMEVPVDIDIETEYGILDLDYLQNHNILSAWVGGPHGWCDWQGNILCNTYNIGKWPSVEGVYAEWETIAKAFPYLELTCQLLDSECCEAEDKEVLPVVEFKVKDGAVTVSDKPGALILNPKSAPFSFLQPNGERGCTLEEFVAAAEQTKKSLAATK